MSITKVKCKKLQKEILTGSNFLENVFLEKVLESLRVETWSVNGNGILKAKDNVYD